MPETKKTFSPLEKRRKKKEPLPPLRKNLSALLTLQTFVVLFLVSVVAFSLAMMYRTVITAEHLYGILSMLVPIAIFVSLINATFSRYMYKYLDDLSKAMSKVAGGDFSVRLDAEKKQPFREVYRDFNTMAEELGGVELMKNDFINGYAHELRTPISSINGFAEMLLKQGSFLGEEEKRTYLEIIASESRRLADLAGNSLLLSKLDSQKIIADKKPYSLDEQLRRCSILLSEQWTQKGIDFEMSLDAAQYTGDQDLMQHLWLNLMGNAVKYTPKGGSISVTLKNEPSSLTVVVADTGRGIAKEDLDKIFDKYYQTDKSHSKQGLGLGLSISKRIVELCGGEISVKSALGEGSSFKVVLPK